MKIFQFIKRNKLLALVLSIYVFLWIVMPDKATLSVKNSMYYVIEMLEIMPVIFLLTSIIEAWVPREVIINRFGEDSGIKGNVFSFVLGSFSAGPIYAAFPVCKMLLKKGASITNIVIILSAWAVIKVPMLANEAKFLGIQFMGWRWILTVVSILLMAYVVSSLVKKDSVPIIAKEQEIDEIKGIDIQEQYCIGCGICVQFLPEHFIMHDKKVKLKNQKVISQEVEKLSMIVNKCPAKAIVLK